MELGPTAAVRFVRCPKCFCVLPEPSNNVVYECGVCFTRLRARGIKIAAEESSSRTSPASDSYVSAVNGTPSMPPETGPTSNPSDLSSNGHNSYLQSSTEEMEPAEKCASDTLDHIEGVRGPDCKESVTKCSELNEEEELKPGSDVLSEKPAPYCENNGSLKSSESRNNEAVKDASASSEDATQYVLNAEMFPLDHVDPNSDRSKISSLEDLCKSPTIGGISAYYDDGMSSNDDLFPRNAPKSGNSSKASALLQDEFRNEHAMQPQRNKQENPSEGKFSQRSLKDRNQLKNRNGYERSHVLHDRDPYHKDAELQVYMKIREIQELLRATSLRNENGSSSEWGSSSANNRRTETPNYYGNGKTSYAQNRVSRAPFSYQLDSDEFDQEHVRGLHRGLRMYWGDESKMRGEEQVHYETKPKAFGREKQSMGKQYVRPVSGAAPFVACSGCLKPLLLPADFLLFERRCHKIKCGACGDVLRFSLVDQKQLVPYTESRYEDMGREAVRLHELLGYSSLSQIVDRRDTSSSVTPANGRKGKGKYYG